MHFILDILKVLFAAVIAPVAVQLIQELANLAVAQLTSEGKLRVKTTAS